MVKALKEIEDRKANQKLSTRQKERFRDPPRLPILWDVLLYQMVCMIDVIVFLMFLQHTERHLSLTESYGCRLL
jgi:hypothetical protein